MASVKSLGLHQPTALHRTIQELGLPQSTGLSSFTWEINTDKQETPAVEDELLVTKTCVVWSRGGIFRKSYKFDLENEPITQALLAYFPAYDDIRTPKNKHIPPLQSKESPKLSKALIVFLKTQAHLYFVSGASHVIHMPFEVEAACAAPQGVIIQRKQHAENHLPVSLKFPKVPPNSFVSSQITAPSLRGSQQTVFSTEGLGKPKSLPLRLSSTLENMWEAPLGSSDSDSNWPRLMTLIDPLQEIGLVVTESQSATKRRKRKPPRSPYLLDPAEEILHIEEIQLPSSLQSSDDSQLSLAVTVNREANTYTVWRLSYIKNGDPLFQNGKQNETRRKRRRSSMQPHFASGTSTPIQTNFRESFGAPLPGKRSRKSERLERLDKFERSEKSDQPLDFVSSLNTAEKEGGVTRRQSRRVSSMLARADLSASQERSVFSEQQQMSHLGGSMRESFGSQGGRHSLNYNQAIHPSLGSLLEAPVDNVLEELRAGGDFEGFHSMGLDDHDFDGLAQEVLFTKIHTINVDSSNVRYSVSNQPARAQSSVFILSSPKFFVDDPQKSALIIGIQDAVDKRLQLLTIDIEKGGQHLAPPRSGHIPHTNLNALRITCGQLRRAHPVVDSCQVTDGDLSAILILSEGNDGRRELSIQAPWLEKTPITIPRLLLENERSLQYVGRVIDRDVRQRRSEALSTANGIVRALRYSRTGGVVDIVDAEDRHHQIQIQLQPRNPLVRKVLDACRSILPSSQSKKMLPGWWHAMMWLRAEDMHVADVEWSALIIHIMSIFLVLGTTKVPIPTPRKPAKSRRRPPSGSFGSMNNIEDWRSLQLHEAPNALGCPAWQQNRGWDWTMNDDDDLDMKGDFVDCKFLPTHIQYAKAYLATSHDGVVPGTAHALSTAILRNTDNQGSSVWVFFVGLHLLLEEQKLDATTPEYSSPGSAELRVVMGQIARWLKWHDFAAIYESGLQEELENRYDNALAIETPPPQPSGMAFDVIEWIRGSLTGEKRTSFITLAGVHSRSTDNTQHFPADTRWNLVTPRTSIFTTFFSKLRAREDAIGIVEAMHSSGIDVRVLETLPEAILTPLRDAIASCQPRPPTAWSKDLLKLIGRRDITLILEPGKRLQQRPSDVSAHTHAASWDYRTICQTLEEYNLAGHDDGDGTERQAVIRALFKDDRRLNEAQDLLSTHKPRLVRLDPDSAWSESQYLEKQKELVSRVATGTLAIPAGRALLYYGLRYPLLTQKFHIGGFNLNCIVRPTNVTVGVDRTQFTEEKVCWGFFHQGVAAGLAISSQAKGIDTSWILYNKPGQDLNNRHAGFLLALGLNGHLKDVAKWVAFKYLTPKHTMTSIGLLLGLAASYLGTMDSLITRLLSVHVTRMLPRGAAELNISPLTQTTGIMGIGLLYCGSQHRRMSEIMMSEVEHVGEDDSPEPLRSECYRLAAGFSLGFINLGKGNDLKGLHDMKLTEKLISIATASKKVDMVQMLDRAAAGAVMALALIFMKSEDHIVARKIDVPESIVQFDYIRPDILLLRTVAKNLILWSHIEPSFDWVAKSLPTPFRFRHRLTGTMILKSTDLPFFSILAGLCFSLALRFAGSGSLKARDILIHYLDQFMRISRIAPMKRPPPLDHPVYDEELARSNARMCQDILALSTSMVMAGTGDLVVLRRLRSLHGRDESDTPYGSHLAAHLAIGALFLGCGTTTFGTSDLAIGSLLVAFYPVLPVSVMDNRAHLQAFRHFWVLATDPRCLVAKDIATGQPISVPVHIRMKDPSAHSSSTNPDGNVLIRNTPCLLPPLSDIANLRTNAGPAFWDVELDFASNANLISTVANSPSLFLKRRPPLEDPFSATLRALGQGALADATHEGGKCDPLEWIFRAKAFRGLSHAEQALVLDCNADTDGRVTSSSAVDARLVLEQSTYSFSRERMQGLKLLFEWADVRDRLEGPRLPPVIVNEIRTTEQQKDEHNDMNAADEVKGVGNGWWMRDSVIETLKGQVFLAGKGDVIQ